MKKIIPIFLTIDTKYAPYASVAIASLIHNSSLEYDYNIHIVYDSLTLEAKEKLQALETPHAHLIFNKMDEELALITNRPENLLRTDTFTLTIFFRLFIPEMFKEYKKAIYIDSDTVVLGDISLLYKTDLEDNLYGGCKDISCQNNELLCNYFKENAGVSIDNYINSGVLLMNMEKLREVKFANHFLYLLNKYHFDTVCPDQDYINAMAYGKILLLDNKWNAMPSEEVIKNPCIVHYNLFSKPWHKDGVLYENYFWEYANHSLFKEEIYQEKKSFTKEKQEEDEQVFINLLNKAAKVMKNDITFKKILTSGLETRI